MYNFACPNWAERLAHGKSLLPELPLDYVKAARAVAIFNKLRLPDVIGQPALAGAAGEWMRNIVRALFGSLDKDSGARHARLIVQRAIPPLASKNYNGKIVTTTPSWSVQQNASAVVIGLTPPATTSGRSRTRLHQIQCESCE